MTYLCRYGVEALADCYWERLNVKCMSCLEFGNMSEGLSFFESECMLSGWFIDLSESDGEELESWVGG